MVCPGFGPDFFKDHQMSFDYIKSYYGVDVKRGQRVEAYGKPGVITGADGQYLRIRLDGQKHSNNYHPIDGINYVPEIAVDTGKNS